MRCALQEEDEYDEIPIEDIHGFQVRLRRDDAMINDPEPIELVEISVDFILESYEIPLHHNLNEDDSD